MVGVSDATSAGQAPPASDPPEPQTPPESQAHLEEEQEAPVPSQLLSPSIARAEKDLVYRRLGFHVIGDPDNGPTTAVQPGGQPTAVASTTSPDLNPRQRALLSLDVASQKLDQGDGRGAANLLETAARNARADARTLNPASAEARFLTAFADNADARARTYRATAPQEVWSAANTLANAAINAEQTAQQLSREGNTSDARLLRAIGADSRIQAAVTQQSATNTNSLIGQGLGQTYQQIVNASFDKKIAEASSWKWPWQDASPRDSLIADKQKMQVVFAELDRTMREEGVSLDRAWNLMFEDNHIDGWNGAARVPGFVTRNDAAAFLRDNEVTKNLLMPFADMARGFTTGDARTIDRAQADLVQSLRNNDQWEIARAVLDAHLREARTAEGQSQARSLDANESREWWKAKAGEFVQRDLPILLLTTAVSGGLGTGARTLATAVGWSARIARGAQIAVEIGSFVPTERILNEAITGRKADWSSGALARDYAFTIGGFALFKALGKGWQALREGGFGRNIISGPKGGPHGSVEVVTPEGVRIRVSRQELEDLVARPMESRARNPIAGAASRLSAEEQQAIRDIAAYRARSGMPEFKPNEPTGTVSVTTVNGKDVYGHSTTLERAHLGTDNRALREAALQEIQAQLGRFKGLKYGDPKLAFLTHAEAEALINAQKEFGKLPEKMKIFVDRVTCSNCADNLNALAELYGVKELRIIDSYGHEILVQPNRPPVKIR